MTYKRRLELEKDHIQSDFVNGPSTLARDNYVRKGPNPYKICFILVDFQKDFVEECGALTLDNGLGDLELIKRMKTFLKFLPKDHFDEGLITYDTHPEDEYVLSDEAKLFPIHCDPKTRGWHLAVNPLQIFEKIPSTQILKKNTYDMWAGTIDKVRPEIEQCNEAVIAGVLADVCDRAAMEGFLKRGKKVTIIKDLTRGLNKEIDEVIAEPQYKEYIKAGKLRTITMEDYFKEINNIKENKLVLMKKFNFNKAEGY